MDEPVVQVEEGKLRGKISIDYKGRLFFSFQGIPYAKAPVGDLRFKAPEAPECWEGCRDATKEGSESLSRHLIHHNPVGSEDCLYLNIYTPKLPNGDSNLPVMVFFHGGRFIKGSSKTELHGPEYLVTGDIILITLNYRLGILGFLSLADPTLGVPGNAALKDIVQALKWIQKNIKKFNGNSQNVTIFGQSAGGTAVHLLMLSPMAKGLFHRAIMQSGCAFHPWAMGSRNARVIAAALGIDSNDEKEILQILKQVPAEKFLEAQDKIKDTWTPNMIRPYGPVIEQLSKEQAFLLEHPMDIMISGKYHKVPLMLGYTSREGMLSEMAIKKEYGFVKMFSDFEEKIPHFYNLTKGSELSLKIANMIKIFYYGNEEPSMDNMDTFYQLETDVMFLRGIFVCLSNLIETMKSPIYLYRLSIETELNIYKKIGGIKLPGVCHADDVGYLFKTIASPKIDSDSLEAKSIHRIVKLWTTFARYGNPNPPTDDPLIDVTWETVTPKEYQYLDIGANLKTGINEDLKRMKVWDDITELTKINYKL